MHMKRIKMILAILLACAGTGWGGTVLSVRLVETSKTVEESSPGLEDVVEVLSRNLPFNSFTLLGNHAMELPARQTFRMRGFTVRCYGRQEELMVAIMRRDKVLISTLIRLQDGKPVILGGFPSEKGRRVFVFVAE